ncbi:MAG: hypothetical protein A2Z34_07220 [Planctomycetes bacterium RBG_16_59_8]|nr:MAG: hypothetical protein A2Z34_07220 [Planctomycetes bacterium RBG_16_59_8]
MAFLLFAGCGKESEEKSPVAGAEKKPVSHPKPAATKPLSYTLTPLVARRIDPSSSDQTVACGALSVTIPGGLLKEKEELVISSVANPPPSDVKWVKTSAIYDIALGKPREFAKPLMIEVSYETEKLAPEAILGMVYWDDAQEVWVSLPSEVDRQKKVVRARTAHLCPTAIASAEDIAAYTGDPVLPADRGKWYYANEHFVMSFFKAEVEASTCDKKNPRGFKEWQDASVTPERDDMPFFVESVWAYVNRAQKGYADAQFRPLPVFDDSGFFSKKGTYIYVGGSGSSARNKITGNISVTLDILNSRILGFTCAHELFHSIENRYYNCAGMTSRKWWMEACADYAAEKIALCGENQMGGDKVNPRYFEKCLTASSSAIYDAASEAEGGVRSLVGLAPDRAIAEDPHGYHEYTGAFFIDFLVQKKGVNFKEMFEEIAKSYNPYTETPLDAYLNGKGGLAPCYRDFVRWWLFDAASPIYSRCGVKDPLKELTATGLPVELAKGQGELRGNVQIDTGHAGKLWALAIAYPDEGTPGIAVSDKVKVEFASTAIPPADMVDPPSTVNWQADIHLFKEGKADAAALPAACIQGGTYGSGAAEFTVARKDLLALLMFNHDTSGRLDAAVKVTRPVLKMKNAYNIETYVIGSEHTFAVEKEGSGIPADAEYQWNFGDGSSGRGAQCSHKYTSAGAFPVTVTATWTGNTLQAKSEIKIAPDKPEAAKAEANIYVFRWFKNKMGKSKQACQNFRITIKDATGKIYDGGESVARNGLFSIVLPVGHYTCNIGYTYTMPQDHGTASGAFDVTAGGRNWVEIETVPHEAFDK